MRVLSGLLRAASAAALILGGSLAAEAQEIKIWTLTFANDSANRAWQEIIKQFQDANAGVTIKVEQRATDEHKSAMRVASGSEQGPDIYFMWGGLGLGGEFVKSGLALPMDKYYAQYKWDDRFLPVALSFSKQYAGGPIRCSLHVPWRGALLQQGAVPEGRDNQRTEDLRRARRGCRETAKAGIPAITFGGTVNWHLMRLMDEILETQCGVDKHDALMNMKVSWADEPCATKSFEELHLWSSKYTLKPFMGIDQLQAFNLFLAGRAAMMLEGDWLVGQLRDAKELADYAVVPFPTGGNRLYGFAEYNYISTKSKNPDIAAKFLDFLESTPVQQANLGQFGATSVNKEVKSSSTEPLEIAWSKIFGEFSGMFVNGDQAFPLNVTTEYWRIINQVATDTLDPKAAGGELQKFIASAK